jgi:hypothetical protein
MSRYYFFWIVLIALFALLLTFYSMWEHMKPPPLPPRQLNPPALSPFKSYISGVGIVEASTDNISIGTPVNRIVNKVLSLLEQK